MMEAEVVAGVDAEEEELEEEALELPIQFAMKSALATARSWASVIVTV